MEKLSVKTVLAEIAGAHKNLASIPGLEDAVRRHITNALPELERKQGSDQYAFVLRGIFAEAKKEVQGE